MSNWDYVREEQSRLEAGDYRVAIVAAEEATSKSGNPMIVVTVQPNGSNIKIKSYIVKNQYFNRNMTQFFDAFRKSKKAISTCSMDRLLEPQGLKKMKTATRSGVVHKCEESRIAPAVGRSAPERLTVTDILGFEEMSDAEPLPF